MRAWLLPTAGGVLIAVVGVLAIGSLDRDEPTPSARADALARELRCPDCQGLSVADSPTQSARTIRAEVDELIAGGATDDEVREYFVARYGEWILLAPSAPLFWVTPFAAVVAALAALAFWLGRRTGSTATAASPLSVEERRRLHEEAEALDA